jgi:hypothetical protein
MITVLLGFGIIGLAIAGLAIGVLAGRAPLAGSCGGLSCKAAGACPSCPNRRGPEEPR